MSDFIVYALISSASAAVAGGILFLLLARKVPDIGDRLRIVLPATLLAIVFACLVPPAVATLRGGTVLPSWSAWLLPLAALFILPAVWRSVLNRLPVNSPLLSEPADEAGADAWEAEETGVREHKVPGMPPEAIRDRQRPDDALEDGNLLAEIAMRHMTQGDRLPSVEKQDPVAFIVEADGNGGTAVEKDTDSILPVSPEPIEATESQEGIDAMPADELPMRQRPDDRPKEPTTGTLRLEPYPVPYGSRMSELLESALDARQEGRVQEAVSWFLASLSAGPGQSLHDDVLLDLCALLRESGCLEEAVSLLSSDFAIGTETTLMRALRMALVR